jgi:hypothetical protein
MQIRLTVLAFLILLFAGSNACAQAWPEHTEPGIDFWNWIKFSQTSVQWIRLHHLRAMAKIEIRKNPAFKTDTEKWVISYSGDTLFATRIQNGKPSFIDKYDGNDTLRSDEFLGDSYSTTESYDSCGRIISRTDWNSKEYKPTIQKWSYIDNGRCIREKNPWYSIYHYYSLNGRIDSEIILEKGKKRVLDRNFYDKNNRLVNELVPNPDSRQIDSFFYYPNGTLKRRSMHELNPKTCSTPCLCWDNCYDSHGNLITDISVERHSECGSAPDTTTTIYEYDSIGRPVKRIDSEVDGCTMYQWMPDNRPVSAKAFNGNGKIVAEEQYTYEF